MSFEIQYHQAVVSQDIPKLSKEWREAIKNAIEKKLTTNPEIFGKPLRYSVTGYRKLRVEDYRIVFRMERDIVKVFVIQHRSRVYKILRKRI